MPCCLYCRKLIGGVFVSAIISLVSILGLFYFTKIQGHELTLIAYAGPFPVWCVFFIMGCYMRKCERNYSLQLPLVVTVLGIVMSYAETYWWNVKYEGEFGIKFSSFIYSMAVIVVLFSAKAERVYKHNMVNKSIEYVGRISFAIYMYHLFVVEVLSSLHLLGRMHWVVRWLICLTATIVVIEVLKKILLRKYSWCFGV